MLKIIGRDKEFEIEVNGDQILVDGVNTSLDFSSKGESSFHVLNESRGYSMEVIQADFESKSFTIRVNNQEYTLSAKDRFDELLEKLGMDNLSSQGAEDLKAPMPGLVLDVPVEVGQQISKGDQLIVLEAMKMENSIKAAADAVVKSIDTEKGQAVEKNQVLITFE